MQTGGVALLQSTSCLDRHCSLMTSGLEAVLHLGQLVQHHAAVLSYLQYQAQISIVLHMLKLERKIEQGRAVAAGRASSGGSSLPNHFLTSGHSAVSAAAMRLQAGSVVQRGCTRCGSGQEVLPASPVLGCQ